ncbi:hypothetical protein C8J57DRAFT_1341234 [Mycena rebaudengoi]|nr:hypothetical protein C8J57DRAFT_1341234 [Mycena rebaudengoi]
MSQRHQPGRKKCKELELEAYSPRLSQAQLSENHRQSVRKHYVRNADKIREKRRIQMAEKKREKQLRRRRWDPVKKTTPHALPESELPTAAQLKPTGSTNAGASPWTTESRSPEELAAIRGLFLLRIGRPAVVDNEAIPFDMGLCGAGDY